MNPIQVGNITILKSKLDFIIHVDDTDSHDSCRLTESELLDLEKAIGEWKTNQATKAYATGVLGKSLRFNGASEN